METYNTHKDESNLFEHLDLILIQAVIFAGFAVWCLFVGKFVN
jgi:hypothetical protein